MPKAPAIRTAERDIPATNEIQLFFHCAKCIRELPHGMSPQEYSRTQAGFTKLGIQVWCDRHDANVIHVDFEGIQHPANLARTE